MVYGDSEKQWMELTDSDSGTGIARYKLVIKLFLVVFIKSLSLIYNEIIKGICEF